METLPHLEVVENWDGSALKQRRKSRRKSRRTSAPPKSRSSTTAITDHESANLNGKRLRRRSQLRARRVSDRLSSLVFTSDAPPGWDILRDGAGFSWESKLTRNFARYRPPSLGSRSCCKKNSRHTLKYRYSSCRAAFSTTISLISFLTPIILGVFDLLDAVVLLALELLAGLLLGMAVERLTTVPFRLIEVDGVSADVNPNCSDSPNQLLAPQESQIVRIVRREKKERTVRELRFPLVDIIDINLSVVQPRENGPWKSLGVSEVYVLTLKGELYF